MINATLLKVGDQVGIRKPRHNGRVACYPGVVSKVTKTTIQVETKTKYANGGNAFVWIFNINSGIERGGGSYWHQASLISVAELDILRSEFRMQKAKDVKMDKRLAMIGALQAASYDDAKFALALEALNQQEYSV